MKQDHQHELLDTLAELRIRYPEWRFGQLISNLAGWADQLVWDIEDQELLVTAEQHLQALAQREPEVRT